MKVKCWWNHFLNSLSACCLLFRTYCFFTWPLECTVLPWPVSVADVLYSMVTWLLSNSNSKWQSGPGNQVEPCSQTNQKLQMSLSMHSSLLVWNGRFVYQDPWQNFYSQVVASFTLSKEIRNSKLCQSKKFNSFFWWSLKSLILTLNLNLSDQFYETMSSKTKRKYSCISVRCSILGLKVTFVLEDSLGTLNQISAFLKQLPRLAQQFAILFSGQENIHS